MMKKILIYALAIFIILVSVSVLGITVTVPNIVNGTTYNVTVDYKEINITANETASAFWIEWENKTELYFNITSTTRAYENPNISRYMIYTYPNKTDYSFDGEHLRSGHVYYNSTGNSDYRIGFIAIDWDFLYTQRSNITFTNSTFNLYSGMCIDTTGQTLPIMLHYNLTALVGLGCSGVSDCAAKYAIAENASTYYNSFDWQGNNTGFMNMTITNLSQSFIDTKNANIQYYEAAMFLILKSANSTNAWENESTTYEYCNFDYDHDFPTTSADEIFIDNWIYGFHNVSGSNKTSTEGNVTLYNLTYNVTQQFRACANDTNNNVGCSDWLYFTLDYGCTPSWSCSVYGNCNTTGLKPCINVTDSNSCGVGFSGLLNDYQISCIYCDEYPGAAICASTSNTTASGGLDFIEWFWIFQFLAINVIWILKLLNIFKFGQLYSWEIIALLLILNIFLFGINMILTPLSYDSIAITQLSKLERLPFALTILFTIVEIGLSYKSLNLERQRYTPR